MQQNQTKSFTVRTEGFPNENLDYISFATQYEKSGSPEGDEYTSRLVGFLGNLNYSYDERFLVDLSFRESAGLGWNLHHEKFLKNVNWLQQLKIRVSYGLTGSQNYDPYQAITTYGYLTGERYHYAVGGDRDGDGKPGSFMATLQQNYGVDLTLWGDRLICPQIIISRLPRMC